ncbi:GH3 family domain-containing protein [Salinimicrobium oceani]|uniref:GH3 auxin-responsive promoter family protein n=1 Tax=Salinimicrobium oceani TaxID=2722702 RepID=A0ABX1CUV5_9FLAO|nr:GH3 auxin-responsive promoter family protein [Salinimicrobium oceani]NJW51675.1 GH3 auxin-responsive promoter family protein [Salinimicrobium oceani]
MAVIGSIIKGIIHATDAVTTEPNAVEAQEKVLQGLLEKAKDTAFGRHYEFAEILKADDIRKAYAERVPFFDYNKINEEWWSKMHQGEDNVTWPGNPPYFALSSGTTGKSSKRIPVTDDMVEAIRQTGLKQVASLANYDLPSDFFQKEIMMLGSSTDLNKVEDHEEGEISGISASNIPFWFRNFYKPGVEISQIEDWDERVLEIAKEAKNWDIGAMSGIPSWTELMIKKILEYHNAKNIHEIWPNLLVYTTGGVAFEPYEKAFEKLVAHPLVVIDTYLASEGFMAFQARPETHAMKLVLDNGIYFEFVPFKPEYIAEDGAIRNNAPTVKLEEVEPEVDYVLLISTVSGAWRYVIGDTIKFTDVDRKEIRITGRTKFFLNVVGSQLSVNKMNDAVKELEQQFGITIPEFTVAAVKNDQEEYIHKWYLGIEEGDADEKELAAALDEALKAANKNYGVARSKALKGVEVVKVGPEVFTEWSAANKKKGGQVKMEKVMNEEKFAEWEKFVRSDRS